MQPAVAQDVCRARRQRRDETVGDSQLAAERDRRRLLHEQRVRTAVDHPAVEPFGGDDAAGARRRFEDPNAQPALLQLVRGGQPGDAAADDGDVEDARTQNHPTSELRTEPQREPRSEHPEA